MHEFKFQYPNGPLIDRHLSEFCLNSTDYPLAIVRHEMNTGWVWYQLPAFNDHSIQIVISLAFYNDVLSQISLAHVDELIYGSSWSSWSENKELLRVQTTKKWLENKGYSLGKYAWGEIWANYDPKSGSGSAGIRFNWD